MISAKVLAKHIDSGYLAMNKNKRWMWWPTKPSIEDGEHWCSAIYLIRDKYPHSLDPINIKPVRDWKKSLIKCGE